MYKLTYQCPCCGDRWFAEHEAKLDSQCPQCDEVSEPIAAEELPGVPDRPRVQWHVSRTVYEYVSIEARSAEEAKDIARALDAEHWERGAVDSADYDAEYPPPDRFRLIAGLPIK